MKIAGAGTVAVLLLFLSGFPGGGPAAQDPPGPAASDLVEFVPAAAEVPGWAPRGEVQRFAGDDLYVYIDGGAEIFNEYGFRRVLARDFQNAAGMTVALEIYEMTDPDAAFGIYSFQAGGTGRPAGLGTEGEVEDYYLRFRKGPFLVTVTGYDPGGKNPDGLLDGVLAIARAADARMKATAGRPAFVEALPPEWTGPGLKYLRGILGLNNIHPFFPRDVFRFREAAAVPVEGGWLFIFGYRDAAEAEARLAEVREAMATGPGYGEVRLFPDGHFEAAAHGGKTVFARTAGNRIGLVVAPGAASVAKPLLERLR